MRILKVAVILHKEISRFQSGISISVLESILAGKNRTLTSCPNTFRLKIIPILTIIIFLIDYLSFYAVRFFK